MKTAPVELDVLQRLQRLIEPEFGQLDERLRAAAKSSLPVVNDIRDYLDRGGKRLRPALLLLLSRLAGARGETPLQLAVVVEMIHLATLVHDDIIDHSSLRRGHASANARWGNQITVLFGDWLYMTAFSVALKQRNFRMLDVLIDITRRMVEGELLQLELNYRLDVTPEDHLQICLHKTGYLFAGCGRLAALAGDLGDGKEEQLAGYGRNLGLAFQMTDDLLDYTADTQILGKPVLKDLEEGKITLPLIHTLSQAGDGERAFVEKMLAERDFGEANKQRVLALVEASGGLQVLRARAGEFADRAASALDGFPETPALALLRELPGWIVAREY